MRKSHFPRTRSSPAQYAPLRDETNSCTHMHGQPPGLASWSLSQVLLTIVLCLASSLVGFSLHGWLDGARGSTTEAGLMPSLKPVGTLVKTFEFNEIFSAPPSKDSNRAWAENLPLGKGFMVEHSHLSNISEFSVFHQLHCIDTIRHGYYAALANRNATVIGEHKAIRNHRHVSHCFDFLRQCVECAADTNVEPVDWSVEGVTGWGFERVCRDFGALKEHAEKWRVPGIE